MLGTTKIYIAGPMSGIPDYNRNAFKAAERMLINRRGILKENIFNPAEQESSKVLANGEIPYEEGYRQCLALDLDWIARHATMMYMLRGWENSPGANAEWYLAKALKLSMEYQ